MQIDFLLQSNVILLHLELLNEWFVLYDLSYVLKLRQGIYSFFNIQRIKSHFFLMRVLFLFELYLFTNALIFYCLANLLYFFLIYFNCCSVQNAFVIKTDRIYFCLLVSSSNIENLYRFITFKIHFITFVMKKLGQSNIKSLPSLNSYKHVWDLERSESKSSWITWSI